jgi:hypothetical protein
MLRYKDYDGVVALKAVPEDYLDADSFFRAYQATRLLQKSEWLPTTFDKEALALVAFHAAERSCAQTNELFKAWKTGNLSLTTPGVSQLLKAAKRKISSILRGVSPYEFMDLCGFGPGADMSTRSGLTAAYNKLLTAGSVTRGASKYLDFMLQNSAMCTLGFSWDIGTRSLDCARSYGNRVAFVPKDCKIRRTIKVEPRWNAFLQKGMGSLMRRQLRRAGVNLDDQSINQHRACYGSIHGTLATLDLQSASDSVSYELVHYLLPAKWVEVLEALRCPMYLLKGRWHKAEKWSSMGNGYTFELESLIFYALCWSVCGAECSVYGDDLVVPTSAASEVVELLRVCGFTVNSSKSHTTGPFRESCGSDYYNGVFVTPIYWKEPLHAEGTLRLVNQISVLACRFRGDRTRDRRFRRVHTDLVNRLPQHYRRKGPPTETLCVHSPHGEWAVRARWGWDGWELKKFPVRQPIKLPYRDYPAAVLAQHFQPSTGGYSVRDRTRIVYKDIFVPAGGLIPWEFRDVGHWT